MKLLLLASYFDQLALACPWLATVLAVSSPVTVVQLLALRILMRFKSIHIEVKIPVKHKSANLLLFTFILTSLIRQ